jgi:hypothetical protein
MLKVQDWHMVVVGDKGGVPFNITAANLVYLDVTAQQALGNEHPKLLQLLPWRHFGRKNLGYLYAITHGAEIIWDFDDDNGLKPNVKGPQLPSLDVLQVVFNKTCDAFNPYPVMGGPTVPIAAWPRGFPLAMIKHSCTHNLVPTNLSKVAVVQSLADHEPDVDGIYRLTRIIPFEFDSKSRHTLVIPAGTLVPYNAQATLVLQPAFFTQLLPITVR